MEPLHKYSYYVGVLFGILGAAVFMILAYCADRSLCLFISMIGLAFLLPTVIVGILTNRKGDRQ